MTPDKPTTPDLADIGRRLVEAFNVNARDIEGYIAYCDPSIEFHSVFAAVGGAVYHGHDEMRTWHRDQQEAWGRDIRLEPEAYFALGEHTLLLFFVYHGRGEHSGAQVAMPAAAVTRRSYHFAFSGSGGLNVFDVWDSQESFDKFGETLVPIMAELGTDPGEPVVAEVHNIIVG